MRAVWTFALVVPAGDARVPPSALPHEGYVWQRAWTDEVRDGVLAASAVFDGLRINAAAVEATGTTIHAVDLQALAATGRPVVAVVRVDADQPVDGLASLLLPLIAT